jgi:hypothetical protein
VYGKQTWTNGVSVANATTLGHIEDGLDSAHRQRGSKTILVAGSGETQAVKDGCHYVCDGTADEVQINAALVDASGDTLGLGSNGGAVVLVGRKFNIAGPVLVKSQTELRGAYGAVGTFIVPAASYLPGATGGLVEMFSTDTSYIHVHGLAFDDDGTAYDGNGVYFEGDTGQSEDMFIKVSDLFINDMGASGMVFSNVSGGRLRGCMADRVRVLHSGSHGVVIDCPDIFMHMVDVGDSVGDGFFMDTANAQLSNCKSWFSDGHGYNMISGGRDIQMSSCTAQDNALDGFRIDSRRVTIGAGIADSNGRGTNNGSGFFVGATGFNIQGTAFDKREFGPPSHQQYGVQFEASTDIGIVNVTTWQNAVAPSGGATPHANAVVNVREQ